jgi:hypothetical protein
MRLRKWILVSVLCSVLVGCAEYSSGDRVLVSKPSYDNGVVGPNRYDVVVFRYPREPVERGTPKNYIKRLLGLPGELLAIFFGNIYRIPAPPDQPFFDDVNGAEKADPKRLWDSRQGFLHTDDAKTQQWFDEGKFEILRKPPQVTLAMRRLVYDNDFQAKDLKGRLDRWSPRAGSNWKAENTTSFAHAGQNDKIDWLRYQHLLRPDANALKGAKVDPSLITDSMDYNSFQVLIGRHVDERRPTHQHWVGDLMLECNVDVTEAKGEFWIELSKGIDRFRARWDLSTGQCTLFREGPDKKLVELDTQPTNVKSPGNYMLRLANVDARLTVWVDRALPFGEGKEYDPPEVRSKNDPKDLDPKLIEARRGPTSNDLEPASVGSKGANVKVSHLRIWRDTYYTTVAGNAPDYEQGGLQPNVWSDPAQWDTFRRSRFTTMYVQPGHYLCLGDNSQASSDSRDWGLVPERLMLGRALVVYFPLDRMGPIR